MEEAVVDSKKIVKKSSLTMKKKAICLIGILIILVIGIISFKFLKSSFMNKCPNDNQEVQSLNNKIEKLNSDLSRKTGDYETKKRILDKLSCELTENLWIGKEVNNSNLEKQLISLYGRRKISFQENCDTYDSVSEGEFRWLLKDKIIVGMDGPSVGEKKNSDCPYKVGEIIPVGGGEVFYVKKNGTWTVIESETEICDYVKEIPSCFLILYHTTEACNGEIKDSEREDFCSCPTSQ